MRGVSSLDSIGHSGSSSGSSMGVVGGLSFRTFGIIGNSIDGTEDPDLCADGRTSLVLPAFAFGLPLLDSWTGDEALGSATLCTELAAESFERFQSPDGVKAFSGLVCGFSSGLLGLPVACFEARFALVLLSPDIELVPLKPKASFKDLGVRGDSGVCGVL